MKYLYKGMALPEWGDVSGSVLLGWHEKVRLRLLVSSHVGLTVLPCAVDGGSGNWLHCARDDGQKTCMMNLKHRMYNIGGMLLQTYHSPEVPLRTLELARATRGRHATRACVRALFHDSYNARSLISATPTESRSYIVGPGPTPVPLCVVRL